jgi:hypothetical protein
MSGITSGKEIGQWDNSFSGGVVHFQTLCYSQLMNSRASCNYHESKPQLGLIHGINTPNSNNSFFIKLV